MKLIDRNAWLCVYQKRKRKQRARLLRYKKIEKRSKKRKENTTKIETIVIHAPDVFELRHKRNREKLLKFISEIQKCVLLRKKSVKIDFSNTTNMVVCGTLRFFAELHSIEKELGSLVLISCNCPKNETVAQVLQHLGILKMLYCHCDIEPKRNDVVIWRIAHDNVINATEVGKILEEQLPRNKSQKLYRGVSEAMSNVSEHAYLQTEDGAEKIQNKGWWLFYKEENNHVFVAVCDLRVGIPVTLPKTIKNNEQNIFDKLINKLFPDRTKYSDAQLIQAAIEFKKSRTNKSNRGKGFIDIVKTLENTQGGKLTILSNKGSYFNDFKNPEKIMNYQNSISGTLILWSFDMQQSKGNTI